VQAQANGGGVRRNERRERRTIGGRSRSLRQIPQTISPSTCQYHTQMSTGDPINRGASMGCPSLLLQVRTQKFINTQTHHSRPHTEQANRHTDSDPDASEDYGIMKWMFESRHDLPSAPRFGHGPTPREIEPCRPSLVGRCLTSRRTI
jgi:hypothetical protein